MSLKVRQRFHKNLKDMARAPNKLYIKRHFPEDRYVIRNLLHVNCVAVFPELGIVFNRIKKAGNSTICLFLLEVSNRVANTEYAISKESAPTPVDLSKATIDQFSDYYSFVVVRDPYVRALSTFLQKLGKRCPKKYQGIPGGGQDTPQGFLDFLIYLESGNLYYDRHFWPQVDLLYQPVHQYNYVGKLENLVSDMRNILAHKQIEPSLADGLEKPHHSEIGNSDRITSSQNKLADYYTSEARQKVYRLYQNDFKAFDYPTKEF